jgi:hypothetical protein
LDCSPRSVPPWAAEPKFVSGCRTLQQCRCPCPSANNSRCDETRRNGPGCRVEFFSRAGLMRSVSSLQPGYSHHHQCEKQTHSDLGVSVRTCGTLWTHNNAITGSLRQDVGGHFLTLSRTLDVLLCVVSVFRVWSPWLHMQTIARYLLSRRYGMPFDALFIRIDARPAWKAQAAHTTGPSGPEERFMNPIGSPSDSTVKQRQKLADL